MTAATGKVSSPDYPGLYPNGMDCTTRITVNPGLKITLSFDSFKLNDNRYTEDTLKIIDGSNVITYYGFSSHPAQFTSKTNTVVLRFKSDSSGRDYGYLATYRSV